MTVGFTYSVNGSPVDQICETGDLMYPNGCDCYRGSRRRIYPRGGNIIPFCPRGGYDNGFYDYGFRNPIKERAEQLVIKKAVKDLEKCIVNNNSSQIVEKWENYKNAFKNTTEYQMLQLTGNASEEEVNALMKERFERMTGLASAGRTMEDLIEESAHSNCVSGLINVLTLGIAQDKSSDKLIEELIGTEQPPTAAAGRVTGAIIGGVAAGAAIGTAFGGPIGAAGGAVIGAIAGCITKLWS